MSLPCTSAESGSTCQAHQGRRTERSWGWGASYFSSITLVLLDLLPLLVSCFCRFICRILICGKTGDLATSGLSAVSLSALTPNSVQIIPACPLVWAPNLGLWKPAACSLPRTSANPPQKEKNYTPIRAPRPCPRPYQHYSHAVSFSYPCLHPGPLSRRLSEGSLPLLLAYRSNFLQEVLLVCAPSHHF